jgi:hypothetical protein
MKTTSLYDIHGLRTDHGHAKKWCPVIRSEFEMNLNNFETSTFRLLISYYICHLRSHWQQWQVSFTFFLGNFINLWSSADSTTTTTMPNTHQVNTSRPSWTTAAWRRPTPSCQLATSLTMATNGTTTYGRWWQRLQPRHCRRQHLNKSSRHRPQMTAQRRQLTTWDGDDDDDVRGGGNGSDDASSIVWAIRYVFFKNHKCIFLINNHI